MSSLSYFYSIWGKGSAFSSHPTYKDTQPKGISKLLPIPKESKDYITKSDGINSIQREVIHKLQLPANRKKSPLGIYW